MHKLSKKDEEILAYLRAGARRNLTEISKATKIPVSTVFDRLRKFEQTFIMRHTSLLDYQKLGLERKQIFVKVAKEDRDSVLTFLLRHRHVNTICRVDNKFDFMVEIVFSKLVEYYEFLEALEQFHVLAREEYYVIDDLKREAFLMKKANDYLPLSTISP